MFHCFLLASCFQCSIEQGNVPVRDFVLTRSLPRNPGGRGVSRGPELSRPLQGAWGTELSESRLRLCPHDPPALLAEPLFYYHLHAAEQKEGKSQRDF